MEDYMRNTILSRIGGFGCSETPMLVQDNARSFASCLERNGKRQKRTIRKLQKSGSSGSGSDIDLFRWESSNCLYPKERFPLHADGSTRRYPQERWSNGMFDAVKDTLQLDDRSGIKRPIATNLKVSLARDLNIPTKTLGNHTLAFQSDEEPKKGSPSFKSRHSNPQHRLIRPERIPSSECFWNSKEHRSLRLLKKQPTVPEANSQWERMPQQVSANSPSA